MSDQIENEIRLRIGIATRVARLREKRGLTQQQLAKLLSIGRPQLANIEAGRGFPSVITVCQIATALKCRVGYLFGEGDKP